MKKYIIFVCLLPLNLRAQDVYNFYFQKGQAPNVVQQGTSTEKQDAPAQKGLPLNEDKKDEIKKEVAGTTETLKATAEPASEDPYRSWTIGAGVGRTSLAEGASSNRMLLGVQWMPWKYLGFGAEVMGPGQVSKDSQKSAWSVNSKRDEQIADAEKSTIGSLYIKLSPFQMRVFGSDMMQFFIKGGGTTHPRVNEEDQVTQNVTPTYGGGVDLKLGSAFVISAAANVVVNRPKSLQYQSLQLGYSF